MFKKFHFRIFIIVLAFSMPLSASAQTLADTVAQMYKQYFELLKENQQLADSFKMLNSNISSNWTHVDEKLSRINNDLSSSLQQVNRLTKNDLLTKEARINTKKQKILATSTFIRSANNSFDAIDAALAQSDYLGDVGSLSSPTNTDLGFSLSDEVAKIVQRQIIKNRSKVGSSKKAKVMRFIQEMVKNPVVTSFTSTVPALGSINAVVGLVSNLVINDKKVTVKDYAAFKKELEKYISHYEALGRANSEFNSNIDKLRTQTEGLRVIVRNFSIERILTMTPKAQFQNDVELHEIISQFYNRTDLEKEIDDIIRKYRKGSKLDLQGALNEKRLDFPFYAFNQAQFIQQELESIATEYVATYEHYHEDIIKVLMNSKSLSKEPAKIDVKARVLEKKLEVAVKAFERNVKIKEVNKNLQRIPNF